MNPEPTIADEPKDQWHKVVAALLVKYGDQKLTVAEFQPIDGMSVVASYSGPGGDTLVLRLVSNAEALRLQDEFQRAARRKN